jgi:hypothetical protein
MEQIEFKDFIKEIVDDVMPDEALSYELGADEIIADIYRGRRMTDADIKGNINFVEESKTVLECATLMFSTFKLFTDVKKFVIPQKKDAALERKVADQWELAMIKSGISKAKANEIVEKFTGRLLESAAKK